MIKDINELRVLYKKEGYAIINYDDGPVHSYPYDAPWLTNPEFKVLYDKMRNNTLVDRTRCYSLYQLMEQVSSLEGDVLEVGSWRGGTAAIFTTMLPHKNIYLADTFQGVVKSSEWEHYNDRAHDDTSVDLVLDFLNKKMLVSNFTILKGIFPEETGRQVKKKKLAFVYLDVDVYLSTKDAFNYVWDNIVVGGIVAFDDYGMISACEGISRFVDEVKDDCDKIFIQNLNGQAYIIKK